MLPVKMSQDAQTNLPLKSFLVLSRLSKFDCTSDPVRGENRTVYSSHNYAVGKEGKGLP
jgi:hypothetical protein